MTSAPEREDVVAALAEARAEIALLLPDARLAQLIMDEWLDRWDFGGFDIQDMAVKAGVLLEAEGGFNPAIHYDHDKVAEEGDQWFSIAPLPAALRDAREGR